MGKTGYGIAEMCADLGVIAADAASDCEIIEQALPLVEWMAQRAQVWLPNHRFEAESDKGFGTNLLGRNSEYFLTISAITWPPGGSIPPHRQEGWEIVSPIFGKVRHSGWAQPESGTVSSRRRPELESEIVMLPGQAVAVMPGKIHALDNIGFGPNLTLHIRGGIMTGLKRGKRASARSLELSANRH